MKPGDPGDNLVRHLFISAIVFGGILIIASSLHAAELQGEVQHQENVEKKESSSLTTIVNLEEREYESLLSELFGRVDKQVNPNAPMFAREFDEFRLRIAREVQYGAALVKTAQQAIDRSASELQEQHKGQVTELETEIVAHWNTILPFVKNDTFLSNAIVQKYNLYSGWWNRITRSAKYTQNYSWFLVLEKDIHKTNKKIETLFTDVNKKVIVRS